MVICVSFSGIEVGEGGRRRCETVRWYPAALS